MSNYNNPNELFKAICDAIRSKTGTTDLINHTDIPAKIESIQTGGGGGALELSPEFAGLLPPGYIEALKSNATQCYGVEFYRKANYWPLKMLFFINANEISIDECVADMAEYIKFEDIDFE